MGETASQESSSQRERLLVPRRCDLGGAEGSHGNTSLPSWGEVFNVCRPEAAGHLALQRAQVPLPHGQVVACLTGLRRGSRVPENKVAILAMMMRWCAASRTGFINPISLNLALLERCWLKLQLASPKKEIGGILHIHRSKVA